MRIASKFLPFLILLSLVLIFFNKTLTGEQFFVTPDYALSDILHEQYPAKLFLSKSLKNGNLPLWNPQIATGFPQVGTITGSFNPINLILFWLLSPPLAFNLGLGLIFLTTGLFTFLYTRSLGLSKIASLLAAVSFTFSGIFATKIIHFTLLQTLSFFPAELYLVEIYLQKKRLFVPVLLALVVGLQILSGHYQIVLYSLITLAIYTTGRIFLLGSDPKIQLASFKGPTLLVISIIFGFLVAAIQLLPSWEFVKLSTRQTGIASQDLSIFPYPPKHLVTFIWPYLLGDPRRATYPGFSEDWGLFWENTGYIGILPLAFALVALIWGRRKHKIVSLFTIILAVTFLLMLGKNSPTFFLFQFPPLSLFRVPARSIIFFTFALCILAAFGFDHIRKKFDPKFTLGLSNVAWVVVLTITTVNLFAFSYFYNPRGQTEKWLAPTQTARFLKQDQSLYRITSIGNYLVWNDQLLNRGWLNREDQYLTFLEILDANFNMISSINHVGSYAIIQTQRDRIVSTMAEQNITPEKDSFVINAAARTIQDLQNVKYIVSPFKISGRDLNLVFVSQTQPPYLVYQNKTVIPRAFVATDWQYAQTPNEQFQILGKKTFNPGQTVILEKYLPTTSFPSKKLDAEITKYEDQLVEIEAQTDSGGILVLADSFYPGWKAYVDEREVEILAANINQRAVVLEKGTHTVKFVYAPESFKKGAIISLASVVTLLALLIVLTYREKTKSRSMKNPR